MSSGTLPKNWVQSDVMESCIMELAVSNVGPRAEKEVKIAKGEYSHFTVFWRVTSIAISPSGGRYKSFGTLCNP